MIWEKSKIAFYTAINLTLLFSLIAVIVLDALSYATDTNLYPSDLKRMDWGTNILSDALSKLQSGLTINIIVAIPQFILGIAALIVQLLINSILFLNWIIKHILYIVFQLIILSDSSADYLANVLAWIIQAPVIMGGTMALGQAIYTFFSGGGKV